MYDKLVELGHVVPPKCFVTGKPLKPILFSAAKLQQKNSCGGHLSGCFVFVQCGGKFWTGLWHAHKIENKVFSSQKVARTYIEADFSFNTAMSASLSKPPLTKLARHATEVAAAGVKMRDLHKLYGHLKKVGRYIVDDYRSHCMRCAIFVSGKNAIMHVIESYQHAEANELLRKMVPTAFHSKITKGTLPRCPASWVEMQIR